MTSSPTQVAVIGAYQTPLRAAVLDQSLEEMIFSAVRGALEDAGLSLEDIDSVVVATSDQVEGRVIESMVTAGAAGAVGKDLTTLASAGEHAFLYAYMKILARQARRILVVNWSKASEGVCPEHAELVSAEPYFLRPTGMNLSIAAGLQAGAYLARHPVDEGLVRRLRGLRYADFSKSTGEALSPKDGGPLVGPLGAGDLPRSCDVACAMILADEQRVEDRHAPAWIDAAAWVTESYDLGLRDLSRFEALEKVARKALRGRKPDVVEVQEISTIGALAAVEALGLCAAGEGARVAEQVNPSGGNLPANPGNAAGFLRFHQAAQQIRNRAGPVQVPHPKLAVGATLHGFAGQGAAVVVFGSKPIQQDA